MSQAAGKKAKTAKKNGKVRIVLIFAVFIYVAWVFISQQTQIQSGKKTLAQVEANIADQRELKDALAEKKELVNSPEFIEKTAREQLGFARPDEIIFYDATLKK
jgi:cell division protein DivIC